MLNKGFTMIEMLVVLSVIAMLGVCYPFLHVHSGIAMQYQIRTIYEQLQVAQHDAILQKKQISVDFQGNSYRIDEHTYRLSKQTSCSSSAFHYTANGNVSKALTIRCNNGTSKKSIVMELGSGRMYVR